MSKKIYKDYFNIDPKYYAAVTAELIESGKVSWKSFYPHETFVNLLTTTYNVLSGKEPRSMWVDGEYGTGKSHAVLTIKSILDATDEDVEDYFKDYGLSKDLCQKMIAVKNAGKLITIHRIGSGSIRSDQDLILAVQDSIMSALSAHGIENHGEMSLRDAALKWFEKKASRDYFNELISEEQYAWTFGGQSVDEIIEKLKTGSDETITSLMRNILTVAEDNGITALRLDIQGMAEWIKSIIEENNISAILFVWDEFTEFFQNNPNSLTGFQTLTEISLSHPFYFMIVAHVEKHTFKDANLGKKIFDRFTKPIQISLPENMAFRLMAQAMKVTNDVVMKKEWEMYREALNEDLISVRNSIRDSIKRSSFLGEKKLISDDELKKIVPIHPYAALILKHMSVAFNSNQRSMFDFIISNDMDSKAFKWFIANYGPTDKVNLLTIDMLWDFFYVKGQNGLSDDVRVILDSYTLLNSDKMSPDEQRVLKTVLLFQAISMRVTDVELVKPNGQNVDLAFIGTGWHKGQGQSIAEKLVRDNILFKKTLGGGKTEYTVANSTGDAATIRKKKDEVLSSVKTQDLIINAGLKDAVQLPAPIAGRYILNAAATGNFTSELGKISHTPDRFNLLVTFALNDDEAAQLKSQILTAVRSGKKEVIIIDASITPMGKDLFDQYVESMAYSKYYAQNDKHRSGEFQKQAEKCLSEWKSKVAAGAFMLYSAEHPSGIRLANLSALQDELFKYDREIYPCGLEHYNVTANMFKKGPIALGAECGMNQELKKDFNAPNITSLAKALSGAWKVERYWEDTSKRSLAIVKIKTEVEQLIHEGFEKHSGRISMSDIYNALTEKPFGFMPNNITAFVLGFVLKEYAKGDYFWSNGSNNEALTVDKMKTMIANVINQSVSPQRNFREEYIVEMNEEQRAFLNCTSKAFRIPAAQCSSIESARDQVRISMKKFSFPIWCIKFILNDIEHSCSAEILSEVIDDYCGIANTANGNKGSESEFAAEIGQKVKEKPEIVTDLEKLLTNDNCRNGMLRYIEKFESGILKQLASDIGDNGAYLDEVKKRFNADAANWVWNSETADDKIRDVILDYKIIAETNKSLPKCISIREVIQGWNNKTNNIRMSYEVLKKSVGDLSVFLEALHNMKLSNELLDQKKTKFYDLLCAQREAFDRFYANQTSTFKLVASSFLSDLDDADIESLYSGFSSGQFTKSASEYFKYVEKEVSEYLKGQLKKKLRDLWFEKTGTKDPIDWSSRYDTPILCMFEDGERPEAKRIFEIMRSHSPSEADANNALVYLQKAGFYDRLADSTERNRCFVKRIVGDYSILLSDVTAVRDYISSHTTETPYYWMDNSAIQNIIRKYADKQYKTGGCERAWSVIDQMDAGELREYLKDLISDNINVGIEILKNK